MLAPIVADPGEKRGGCQVLVVDDDESIRETLSDVLRDEGFLVEQAENGAEALTYLRAQGPERLPAVIVLDLMMPVMSGAEFRERQLDDPRLSKIPVVIMSAADRGGVIAKRMKADAFLPKPPSMRLLLEAIARFF
jgi:CheY-like chemotaxis protein